MRTMTVKIPNGLALRVEAAVRRRGTTRSALVREVLEDSLERQQEARVGSCLELAGDLRGSLEGPPDLASSTLHLKGYGR